MRLPTRRSSLFGVTTRPMQLLLTTAPDTRKNCLINQFKLMRTKRSSKKSDSQTGPSSFAKPDVPSFPQGRNTLSHRSSPRAAEFVRNLRLNPYDTINKLYVLNQIYKLKKSPFSQLRTEFFSGSTWNSLDFRTLRLINVHSVSVVFLKIKCLRKGLIIAYITRQEKLSGIFQQPCFVFENKQFLNLQ